MRSRRSLALAVTVATACATVPEPEGPVPVAPGQRVRVTLASRVAPGPLQGDVVSVSPDTLVVAREEGGERRVSRSQVDEVEVEVSVGRIRDPGRAAGHGILTGAPLIIPVAIFAFFSPYGGQAVVWLILPIAGLATAGVVLGGGPQDVWVDAVWPVSADTSSADAPPPDSLPAEDR